jgi:RNA recognition motif-containing protein
MSKKLYVGNLVYEVTDEDLKAHFSTVGTVVTATVIRFRDSGRSKGFGFVEMGSEEEAQKAIDTVNGQDFKGRKVVVSEARPPRESTTTPAPVSASEPTTETPTEAPVEEPKA